MDLPNMLSLGVTSVMVYCKRVDETAIDVSALSAAVAVSAIEDRLRCGKCG
jgi:hypothetical protein